MTFPDYEYKGLLAEAWDVFRGDTPEKLTFTPEDFSFPAQIRGHDDSSAVNTAAVMNFQIKIRQ